MTYQIGKKYSELKQQGYGPAFDHAGVYRITIDGFIVYIGKSNNMMIRLAEHIIAMQYPDSHKYEVLAEAKRTGHNVNFDKLYDAKSTGFSFTVEEIGSTEGYYIRKYRPPLNAQIPKQGDWHRYDYNKSATTISLEEILKLAESNKAPCVYSF